VRLFRLALWPAGLACGVAAESAAFAWSAPRDLVPDLATGWVLIACGLVAWSRRPSSRCGVLLTATGFAWFLPNFGTVDVAWLAWVSEQLFFLHRGPLVHLVATYPSGRARGRLDLTVVTLGYLAALTSAWDSQPASIVLAGSLAAVVTWQWARATGRERHDRAAAAAASCAFAAVVVLTAAARLAAPGSETEDWTLLVYEASVMVIAVALLAGLFRQGAGVAAVTDLVVELGETRSGTLRDALARALGDPSLELGYWVRGERLYVDAEGRRLELPGPGSERAITRVDREGESLAVLVHDPAVLDDQSLLDAVASAARLVASNARLQSEVREQVVQVAESRLRLLRTRDEERRRLDLRLRQGAELRLEALRVVLADARREANPDTGARIDQAQERLAGALADVRELASGLHPRELAEHGLERALSDLAERGPIWVQLELSLEPLPYEAEAATYFVCSEALANVAKYASASVVDVSVAVRDGGVRVEVRDDGVGGADPAGTGLAGLADRVGALGGTLHIDSPIGGGTRLRAELPCREEVTARRGAADPRDATGRPPRPTGHRGPSAGPE
jgi:signal transduction histidine kinase